MKTVGLTGGIGSGKSTVCKVFRVLGIPVFDSDQEAKRLMVEDEPLRAALASRFGEEVIGSDGLDRKVLAEKVFNDPKALSDLNALVHPVVRQAF
jgi:dephospho-CoA kinase